MRPVQIYPRRTALLGLLALLFCASTGAAQADRIRPIAASANYPDEASRVHVVLLVNSNCSIGDPCVKDVESFRTTLNAGFGPGSDRLLWHDLTGNNPNTGRAWMPEEIYDYLRHLRVEANDSVVVFHSGHGAITNPMSPEQSQVLQINGGSLSRGTLQEIVKGHRPRASVVLTDCCSSFVGSRGIRGMERGTLNAATVRNLFLRLVGEVSLTAAEDGTSAIASYSGANPGGAGSAFTVALLRLLHDQRTFASWEEFFPHLRDETAAASRGVHRARAFTIVERR